jgi:outer membrane protein OmpA-like peptidoglycan-associated protein
LVVWFVNNSDLSDKDKQSILDNLVFFETPDEAAKAFFAGELDAAATWEPYITQAESMTDSHALFTTKASTGLVMDGILFNKAFAEANTDVVNKFIEGALQAADLYETDMDTIRGVMPMFSTATDDEIIDNCAGAKLATWKDNSDLLNGNAKTIYTDMCDVWSTIGESSEKDEVDDIFVDTYVQNLADTFSSDDSTSFNEAVVVTEDNEDEVIDAEAMLTKSATVQFIKSTAKFSDSAAAKEELDKFIKIAEVLDGAIIQVEGNTDPNPTSDPDDSLNKKLSKSRADAVKKYLVMNGIDADRIVTVGNGSSNPVVENDSEENRAKNRRTDISFKMIEQ